MKIKDILFGIAPLEKRPKKCFWLNNFGVSGYDPSNVESYILYKAFMFCVWFFLITSFVYFLPIGFGYAPDFWGLSTDNPVNYYKNDYPKRIIIPLIIVSTIYCIVISYINRRQHQWHFSAIRPAYLKNMKALKKKRFYMIKKTAMHTLLVLLPSVFWLLPEIINFWNSYILINNLNDFDAETLKNFITIFIIYTLFILANFSIFIAIFILFFEKIHSPVTKLRPLFRKG